MTDDDFMETASGLVPLADGWFLVRDSGHRISPEGKIYNEHMDLIGQVDFLTEEEED